MNITLKHIQLFHAVAEAGSFTKAAQTLNMAQPALSFRIKDLEIELGVRLFDRTTRKVILTQAGDEFLSGTSRLVDDFDELFRRMRDIASQRAGTLTIAAPPLLAAAVLPTAIAGYQAIYPGIDIKLVDVRTDEMAHLVRKGTVDVAIGTFSAQEGFSRVVLMRDQLMVFFPKDSMFAEHSEISWTKLTSVPVITLTAGSGIRDIVANSFHAAGIGFSPAFEVEQITTALALVESGIGVAVLPTYAWAGIYSDRIAARFLIAPKVTREIVAITDIAKAPSPAIRAFLPFARKSVLSCAPSTPRAAGIKMRESQAGSRPEPSSRPKVDPPAHESAPMALPGNYGRAR